MTLTFKPAIDYPLDLLVDMLNRGFEGYMVNIRFEHSSLLATLTRDSVDLSLSWVAESDNEPVGMGLIARRGWSARLAAMGIISSGRGQGVGKALLKQITQALPSQEVRELLLEVIEQNTPAVNLYQGAGFETIRRLVGFNRNGADGQVEALPTNEIDIAEVAGHLAAHPMTELPWQLSGTSLTVSGSPSRAYQFEQGYVVISDPAQPTISIRSIYIPQAQRRQGHATSLVADILAQFPDKKWSIPPLCPEELSPIFTTNGFTRSELSQWQMKKEL